jgi:hypothetical protein
MASTRVTRGLFLFVLVCCHGGAVDEGISVGIVAAMIDIISDWLGDLKEGFCRPTFYLNKGFCCWELSGSSSVLRH